MRLKTCYRCGVDFDPTPYIGDAPCPDCQLDVPGDWLIIKQKGGRLTAEERERRTKRIKELHQEGLLDPEIAERMGLARNTVSTWRKKLGLPAQRRPEKHMWKDQDAHIEHASTMVSKRKTVGRGQKPGNFTGSTRKHEQQED